MAKWQTRKVESLVLNRRGGSSPPDDTMVAVA